MDIMTLLKPFIAAVTPKLGEAAVAKIIETFFNNNQIIPYTTTWNLKNNFLVLKLELQTDRAPMTVNDIFIESPTKEIFYPSNFSFVEFQQYNGNYRDLLIDPSSEYDYLKSFIDYFGGAICLDFDVINKISIVFRNIPEDTNLNNWKIIFKNNNKNLTFDLKELINEIPATALYLKQRGVDIEAHVNKLIEFFE